MFFLPRLPDLSLFGSLSPKNWLLCNEMSFLQQQGYDHSVSLPPPSAPPPPAIHWWCASCKLFWAEATYEYIYEKEKGQHTRRMKGSVFCRRVVENDSCNEVARMGIRHFSRTGRLMSGWPAAWSTSQRQVIKLVLQGFNHRRILALWNSKSW